MTNDLGPSPDDAGIAQRPRLVSRFRLLPVAGLCLVVASLALVGVVHGGQVTGDLPASALAPAQTP